MTRLLFGGCERTTAGRRCGWGSPAAVWLGENVEGIPRGRVQTTSVSITMMLLVVGHEDEKIVLVQLIIFSATDYLDGKNR
jgi:hypothetical protein